MTRKSLVAAVAAVIILCAGAAAVVVPVLTSTTSAQASGHATDFWMGCQSIEWSSASCMIACSNMRSAAACYDGPDGSWDTRWPTLEETKEYFGEN